MHKNRLNICSRIDSKTDAKSVHSHANSAPIFAEVSVLILTESVQPFFLKKHTHNRLDTCLKTVSKSVQVCAIFTPRIAEIFPSVFNKVCPAFSSVKTDL